MKVPGLLTLGRQGLSRFVLALAALYHFVFAVGVSVWPGELWRFLGQAGPPPRLILGFAAAGIATLGAAYALAALRFELARPIVAVGLLFKILPPLAWLVLVTTGQLGSQTFPLILFDDLVWYLPFGLILADRSASAKVSVPPRLE